MGREEMVSCSTQYPGSQCSLLLGIEIQRASEPVGYVFCSPPPRDVRVQHVRQHLASQREERPGFGEALLCETPLHHSWAAEPFCDFLADGPAAALLRKRLLCLQPQNALHDIDTAENLEEEDPQAPDVCGGSVVLICHENFWGDERDRTANASAHRLARSDQRKIKISDFHEEFIATLPDDSSRA